MLQAGPPPGPETAHSAPRYFKVAGHDFASRQCVLRSSVHTFALHFLAHFHALRAPKVGPASCAGCVATRDRQMLPSAFLGRVGVVAVIPSLRVQPHQEEVIRAVAIQGNKVGCAGREGDKAAV